MCAADQGGSGIIKAYSDELSQLTAGAKALNARSLELEVAYITGDTEKLAGIGMEYAALLEMGSEVVNEMFRAYGAINNSKEQGEIFGRVMFECAAIILPIAKAGKLEVLGKARIMRSIISAIQASKWYQRLKGLGQTNELDAALGRCVAFADKLGTTRMCFVAGTLVHTDHGLHEIETIQTGDHVLSRDPRTGFQRYQRVAATFVTHPTILYQVVIGACHSPTGSALTSSISSSTTNIRCFKDQCLPLCFPGRTQVPKTLIFAKNDSHADDIVRLVREVFAKGNDFCEKITYNTGTVRVVTPEERSGSGRIVRERSVAYKARRLSERSAPRRRKK